MEIEFVPSRPREENHNKKNLIYLTKGKTQEEKKKPKSLADKKLKISDRKRSKHIIQYNKL